MYTFYSYAILKALQKEMENTEFRIIQNIIQ